MLESLRTDPQAVERLAREKLGLAKPGETVIHFEGPVVAPVIQTNPVPGHP